jgi:RNA polymerase sigma-70 factor (ECF subfamily)
VQDALVTAWLDIRALRDPDRFDAWLHRLLVRACYRAAGAQRRQAVVRIDVIDLESIVPTDPLADLTARDQIDRAFRRITPQERAVLVVHFYLELRDAEAADALGIAAGTFKSRLHRAKASLRAAIDADDRAARRTQETMA